VGVINLTEKKNLEPFDKKDFECVEIVANHVAIAYEHRKTARRLSEEN